MKVNKKGCNVYQVIVNGNEQQIIREMATYKNVGTSKIISKAIYYYMKKYIKYLNKKYGKIDETGEKENEQKTI